MPLKIRLKPHEKIFVNGAVIAAGEQSAVFYFLNGARILLEKDILTEQDVIGPDSRLYFVLQLMYIDPDSRVQYAQHLPAIVEDVLRAHPDRADDLEKVLDVAAKGDYFKAMRLVKAAFQLDSVPSHDEDQDESHA